MDVIGGWSISCSAGRLSATTGDCTGEPRGVQFVNRRLAELYSTCLRGLRVQRVAYAELLQGNLNLVTQQLGWHASD